MKTKHFVMAIALFFSISCVAFADRPLDRAEILQIFEQLTSQPRKTWIPAGAIEATHEEYRAPKTTDPNEINSRINEKNQEYQSNPNKRELTENLQKMKLDAIPFNVRYRLSNEYTMSSTVSVRFDGDRFYWEINVDSRTDSVRLSKDLKSNFMIDQFDMRWNARRIFAWDGQEYTTYFLPVDHAIVDARAGTLHIVNGPLTAGFIPWGYGYYTYDNLCALDSSATAEAVDGRTQIHLTLNNSDGSKMVFIMDPAKDYAVISCLINGLGNSIISKQYANHQLVSGNRVPTTILIEQYDAGTNKLLASDLWNFTRISSDAPAPESFDVKYQTGTLIEYFSDITDKPLMYHYSDTVDTELLLAKRLEIAMSESRRAQNCATVAIEYVALELGIDVNDQQLAQLVSEPNKDTSLYAMKEFAEGLGLYCRAVKTNTQTLRDLDGCEVILHLPSNNHFVVLEGIDNENARVVDLTNNKFYYHKKVKKFARDWAEGTALLISNQPIELQGSFTEIDQIQLHDIIGCCYYSCTRLLQGYNVIFCTDIAGQCMGYYEVYFTRYGCEASSKSGSCTISIMIRYAESPCIIDPYDPLACTVTGEWTCYYMRACA